LQELYCRDRSGQEPLALSYKLLVQLTYSAIQLFVQSARHGDPGFHLDDVTDIACICKLVEGLPLAIELAASWVHQMPCERIAAHIQHDLDFLSTNLRDVPARHRSTRALFEHSWRLLPKDEQAVLRKLSVFRGGFDQASRLPCHLGREGKRGATRWRTDENGFNTLKPNTTIYAPRCAGESTGSAPKPDCG